MKAVASHKIDQEVARYAPCLVVCDRITPRVRATAHSWVHVLPPELRDAVVSVGPRNPLRIKEVGIEDLLAVVDSTREMISGTPGSRR